MRLFLRLLAIVYLCAFWSLAVQVRGLFGQAGILPVAGLMASASRWVATEHVGAGRFLALPTVFWFGSSDLALVGSCIAGVLGSLVLLAGIAPAATLAVLWILYLSFVNVGRDFLSFQWDALLVEAGFLAIFAAPLTWRDAGTTSEPRAGARWLIWWLLFRLMLGSFIVKLASGDPTWRNLTALAFHYETQPLPTPVAWYVWLLPMWFQKISTAVTLAVELIVPWLIVAPRRIRAIACGASIGLQLLIALTGNYAFFNLLTIALSLTLLDDRQIESSLRALRWRRREPQPAASPCMTSRWPVPVVIVVALLTVPLSMALLASQAGLAVPGARTLELVDAGVGPFRIVNAYGLFAVMTTSRPELTVEGTADGITWRPYIFKYKPSPARPRLAWIAPHQPRLDWQMWFAALGDYDSEPWFQAFQSRLLEGSAAVTDLLASNPFPDHPPARVRVRREVYRFATPDERRVSGSVWRRQ